MSGPRRGGDRIKVVAQSGSPYSQEDVDVFGPAFAEIAERRGVDIPNLTARVVREELERDKANPIWKYLNVDPAKAMRAHIEQQLDKLIACVRVVRADIPHVKPIARYESVPEASLRGDGAGRAKVDVTKAYTDAAMAKRLADGKIERLRHAYTSLHAWGEWAKLPQAYAALDRAIGDALEEFDARTGKKGDRAAE